MNLIGFILKIFKTTVSGQSNITFFFKFGSCVFRSGDRPSLGLNTVIKKQAEMQLYKISCMFLFFYVIPHYYGDFFANEIVKFYNFCC